MNTCFVDGFFRGVGVGQIDAATRLALRVDEGGSTRNEPAERDRTFGPAPVPTLVLDIERGSRTAKLGGEEAKIVGTELTSRALSWAFAAHAATLEISLEIAGATRRFVTGLAVAATEEDARAELQPLASALERFISDGAGEPAASSSASAPSVGRYTMALEGDTIVLRDHQSRGPKERVGRYRAFALAALVLGLIGVLVFLDRYDANASTGALFGAGVVPAVLFVGAFALNEIARYANKYGAASAPLAWFADDRVVVEPWVSRVGAVDTTPEGRQGAAIACGEIEAVEVRAREGAFAVTVDGLHGPIEVLVTRDEPIAARWRDAVEYAVSRVASPKKRVTALMRAKTAREQSAAR